MITTFCPEINFAVSTFKPPTKIINHWSSTVSIKQVKGIIHFIILHGSIFHPQNRSLLFTSTVLEHSFHGTFPVKVPSNAGGARVLTVLRPPALPQVHFMMIIYQKQSCNRKAKQKLYPWTSAGNHSSMFIQRNNKSKKFDSFNSSLGWFCYNASFLDMA